MSRQRLAVGLSLVAFPLVVQVPFNLLVVRFSYPDILLRGAAILRLSRLVRETLDKLPLPDDVMAAVDVDPYQLL